VHNDLRGVIADLLSGVIVVSALVLHALGHNDGFTDSLALIAVTYLGMGGVAAKTANGQADRVAANTARVDALEPVVATTTALAHTAAAAAGVLPEVTITAPATVAVVAKPARSRTRARTTAAHGGG
jgi:hypothetical protein